MGYLSEDPLPLLRRTGQSLSPNWTLKLSDGDGDLGAARAMIGACRKIVGWMSQDSRRLVFRVRNG